MHASMRSCFAYWLALNLLACGGSDAIAPGGVAGTGGSSGSSGTGGLGGGSGAVDASVPDTSDDVQADVSLGDVLLDTQTPDADVGGDESSDGVAPIDAGDEDAGPALYCTLDGECDDGSSCTTDLCLNDVCVHTAANVCPWPAEPANQAINLTPIAGSPLDNDFYRDLSGAVFNPVTRMVWLCRNGGPSKVWALVEDGLGGFRIDQQGGIAAEWEAFGDAEAITQADFSASHTVYVLQESGGFVEEYDLSVYGTKVRNNQWNLGAYLGGDGAEGMTFVPDAYLTVQGFVDQNGDPYVSTQGMGGVMFVGHQAGGFVYVFDLNRTTGEHVFVGQYSTGGSETAGLEFDRSTGQLFLWHDADIDQLEVTWLSSTPGAGGRFLDRIVTYDGPATTLLMSTNHEGIAIAPISDCLGGRRRLLMTTDGGNAWSLLMYLWFPC